ncbi:MAG: hypothetical protein ABFD79_04320 [Phycisphaerales bacterium]
MTKLISISLIICLVSVQVFALPLEKNSNQQNTAVSESAQKLIELNTQNQNYISADACLTNHDNKLTTSTSSGFECNCVENSSNCVSIDIGQKMDISNNQTASIGYTQPNWLK